jgi:hypothetical protein
MSGIPSVNGGDHAATDMTNHCLFDGAGVTFGLYADLDCPILNLSEPNTSTDSLGHGLVHSVSALHQFVIGGNSARPYGY